MDSCYHLRRAFALALALVVVASAATAAAQYMYLDANGDGVHSSADVLAAPGGTATFDVWLVTDHNRDGTTAVCEQDPTAPLTINSYTFILSATQGSVAWSGFENRIPECNLNAGGGSTSTEFWVGRAGATILPPGKYRLASVSVTVASGTPSIWIESAPRNLQAIAMTSFGCQCFANDFTNTMMLGSDWFDVDGLPYGASGNSPPVLEPLSPMTVAEGQDEEQTLHASDADGQPITFTTSSTLPYISVSTTDMGMGSATGLVRLTPGFKDAGTANPMILAGDGISQAGAALRVTVTETDLPPTFTPPPSDMTVAQGELAGQTLQATDPDGGAQISFRRVSGPDFLTVTTIFRSWGHALGKAELSPGFDDLVGDYPVTVGTFDEAMSSEASFRVTVTIGNHPPTIAEQPPVTVAPGTVRSVILTATDFEGSPITFSATATRSFVTVTTIDPGTGTGTGKVEIRPTVLDVGDHSIGIQVSDGAASSFIYLDVIVSPDAHAPPILSPISDMVVVEGTLATQEVTASDPDNELLSFSPVNFLPFMRLEPISSGPYEARARIVLEPRVGDRGRATVAVRVTDGASSMDSPFTITVFGTYTGSTMLHLEYELTTPGTWQTFQFRSNEGTFQASPQAGGVDLTFELPPPRSDGTAYGPEVKLACLPAQRPACLSERVLFRYFRLRPPAGGLLSLGPQLANVPNGPSFCQSTDCGGGCPSAAQIDIKQLTYKTSGQIESFWLTFEYVFGGRRSRGEIRYNAALPVWSEGPSRTQAHAGLPITIPLRIGGTGTGPPSLQSPDLPPGALVSVERPDSAALTWTPGIDQTQLWNIHLIAARSDAPPDTFAMLVCVDVPDSVTAVLDVNRVEAVVTNRGVTEDIPNNKPGVFHPRGSRIPVAQSIGLVLAGTVNGQVRAALPWGYPAYHAGPLTNGAAVPFEPRFKNYTIKRGAASSYDWTHWPFDLGAPRDASGSPLLRGDMTIWSVYNDGASTWEPFYPPRPTLDVEVRQTSWGTASQDRLGDVVFQSFRIRNAGANEVRNAYAGLFVDPVTYEYAGHVGSPYRDLTGCDTTLAMGYGYTGPYAYDARNAVGVVLLSGPEVSGPGGLPHHLGFTALQDTPQRSSSPATAYYQLQGLRTDGTPRHERDDPSAPITPYAYTGDPVTGTGWLQTNNYYFGSRFMISTGPFDLLPGQEQQVDVAIVAATGIDRLDAVVRLRAAAAAARAAYANGAPIAEAGGPYSGYEDVPIAFDGSGSTDPDGEALAYAWQFGDGASATGPQPVHTFAEPGSYSTRLVVSDGSLASQDTASVAVAAVDSASAWLARSDQIVRLQSARPVVRILLQPTASGLESEEIIVSSVTLERDDGIAAPISAVSDKALDPTDANDDGTPETAILFRKSDVRQMLADAPSGRSLVPVTIRGSFTGGGRFLASVNLTVEAGRGHLGASIAPNPFNPTSTLTFRTGRSGAVRVRLFDVTGRLVRVLLDEKSSPAGYHDVGIADTPEKRLRSGVYFYRIETTEGVATGRFVVLK